MDQKIIEWLNREGYEQTDLALEKLLKESRKPNYAYYIMAVFKDELVSIADCDEEYLYIEAHEKKFRISKDKFKKGWKQGDLYVKKETLK